MGKFEVGEIAYCVTGLNAGYEVEVLAIAPFPEYFMGKKVYNDHYDYICTCPGNPVRAWQTFRTSHLRKRRPPEQPADEDFQRDLNRWLKRDKVTQVNTGTGYKSPVGLKRWL